MLAINGYFDGTAIHALDTIKAKKNQKLIITILDDFVEETCTQTVPKSSKGMLAAYANQDLLKQEKDAWERAVVEKYGNA